MYNHRHKQAPEQAPPLSLTFTTTGQLLTQDMAVVVLANRRRACMHMVGDAHGCNDITTANQLLSHRHNVAPPNHDADGSNIVDGHQTTTSNTQLVNQNSTMQGPSREGPWRPCNQHGTKLASYTCNRV